MPWIAGHNRIGCRLKDISFMEFDDDKWWDAYMHLCDDIESLWKKAQENLDSSLLESLMEIGSDFYINSVEFDEFFFILGDETYWLWRE